MRNPAQQFNQDMSTVYVFGAGASKHVGYPLASEMGAEILSWMSNKERYLHTADFMMQRFGDSPNIEDVVTELDAGIKLLEASETFEDRLERSVLANLREKLREALPMWFREIRHKPALAYTQFAENVIQAGDLIITFNYDDSLERELKRVAKWDIWQGYGFRIGDSRHPTQVSVLKLHGSINWLVSIFGGVTSGSFSAASNGSLGECPCVATDDLKYLGYTEMAGTFPGGAGFPSLVLPGRNKEFFYGTSFGDEHGSFFDLLWSQAAAALKRAEKIVLCGYSLLAVDQRARDLLLDEPSKRTEIVVVSGDQGTRITNDFQTAGFENVVCYEDGRFETWVSETGLVSS